MKNLFFFLAFLLVCTAQAQTRIIYSTPLYVIFDKDTPSMTRDIRKYTGQRGATQPIMRTHTVSKIQASWYSFGLYLYGGAVLDLDKKEGTEVLTIPLSEVPTRYPDAKTILQVEQDAMPLIEQDFCCPLNPYTGAKRVYWYFDRPIYVIELDKANGKAYVVSVKPPSIK